MLNAPDGSLDGIIELLPGARLAHRAAAGGGRHARRARGGAARQVVELLGPLRAAGARSLLVLPIDNLIP